MEEEWKENFRMSRSSFYELSELLGPFIERKTTHMRCPVSVETQVAVVLYYLSDEGRWQMPSVFHVLVLPSSSDKCHKQSQHI